MKKFLFNLSFATLAFASIAANAQSYKETFDSNSLEWTECGYKNSLGNAIIEEGKMNIWSYGKRPGFINSVNTLFETHCYAPLDVMKPFEIRTKVNVLKLKDDRLVGLVFNYLDAGNFYAFSFNDKFVTFMRYENNEVVGQILQGTKWDGKRKKDMDWVLISDGQKLTFKVDGITLMTIPYMPLSYSGFGYYTFGKEKLAVEEVEFIQ